MATEIKMPQLSDTMHSGKILSWKKQEGDKVSRGDILAEVETEKANLEIESFHEGVLLKILTPAQQSADVGSVIAVVGKPGESYAPAPNGAPERPRSAAAPQEESRPAPQRAPAQAAAPQRAPAAPQPRENGERIKASPLARKIAQERNIDLTVLRGSGPDGRIIRRDVESAEPGSREPIARESEAPAGEARTYPLSKMRETIARRMQQSVTESPHFYTTTVVNMRQARRLYEVLKERGDFKGVSLNHLVVKAAAYGLAHEPRVNRAIRDGLVYEPGSINIGIITAIEDGLLIPVIRAADRLSLRDLVFEARAAVERARAGRPNSTDLSGGTFSISNMGMYDVENFTAIINPGQGAVLAVSSIREEPVVESGAVVPGLRMKATLSVDHRIIDGLMAATFLRHFKEALETPALLAL